MTYDIDQITKLFHNRIVIDKQRIANITKILIMYIEY